MIQENGDPLRSVAGNLHGDSCIYQTGDGQELGGQPWNLDRQVENAHLDDGIMVG